jgi:hypothetical protein
LSVVARGNTPANLNPKAQSQDRGKSLEGNQFEVTDSTWQRWGVTQGPIKGTQATPAQQGSRGAAGSLADEQGPGTLAALIVHTL